MEERPYKDGLSHEVAMSILQKMAAEGQLDTDIIEDIQEEKKKKRHRSKKKSDWNRYIKYQLKKEKNKSLANYKNRKSLIIKDFI